MKIEAILLGQFTLQEIDRQLQSFYRDEKANAADTGAASP